MSGKSESIVRELLGRHGRLYAEDAGIRLADRPGPLYQLLVLATLLSAPIPADTAVAAARELLAAGYRTPKAMSEAGWQDRVDALGRGHYRRYDERTATMLGDGPTCCPANGTATCAGCVTSPATHAPSRRGSLSFPGWDPSARASSCVRSRTPGRPWCPMWMPR